MKQCGRERDEPRAEKFMAIFMIIFPFASLACKFPQQKKLLKLRSIEFACKVVLLPSDFLVLLPVVQNPTPLGHPTYSC